jgi:hypothetical protein
VGIRAGGPRLASHKPWVPPLRDGLIVAKVDIRAKREPLFLNFLEITPEVAERAALNRTLPREQRQVIVLTTQSLTRHAPEQTHAGQQKSISRRLRNRRRSRPHLYIHVVQADVIATCCRLADKAKRRRR